MNETLRIIRNRRSVRAFNPDSQILEADLTAILEAGRMAPSGMNLQPWHFTVIQNKGLLDEMSAKTVKTMRAQNYARAKDENFHVFYNAPTVVIISGESSSNLADADCAIAGGNMLIAAQSLGISSCFIMSFTVLFSEPDDALHYMEELQIPQTHTPKYAVLLGYPVSNQAPATPPRKNDIVTLIK
ncbi:nitroreductase [Elusimicrobium posterum]|uniref:nitroreductase family protein n=1 Tax=Elusimicrobium posterum TaxID=3116653 RepID=UPI003C723AAB